MQLASLVHATGANYRINVEAAYIHFSGSICTCSLLGTDWADHAAGKLSMCPVGTTNLTL